MITSQLFISFHIKIEEGRKADCLKIFKNIIGLVKGESSKDRLHTFLGKESYPLK